MSRNIPKVSIAREIEFTSDGMPDAVRYVVSAEIESSSEYSLLGRICFEDPADLITLRNAIDTFIRMGDIDGAGDADESGEAPEEGGVA